MNYFGLLDCNNFFVSCERLFRPDLRTVPTVVLSSNDGCVVARSKEIKELGIPMGVPYFKVKKELAKVGAAVFSSNFPLYRDISSRVMAVVRQEVQDVEQYSVDEAFFRVEGDLAAVQAQLVRLKERVEMSVGVPVSVGAACTKTIAKYASEVGKKGSGTAIIAGAAWKEIAKTLPVSEIWGIGGKTSQKMRSLGILTVADWLKLDRARVDRVFGIAGLRLQEELAEKPVLAFGLDISIQKSIMSSRSFKDASTAEVVVRDALSYHVAHVAKELRALKMRASWLSIMLRTSRHGDYLLRGGSVDANLLEPTNDTRELLQEAMKLFSVLYEPDVPYKKAGVIVGQFVPETVKQESLFATPSQTKKNDDLMQIVDTLNDRFGGETVTVGRLTNQEAWRMSRAFVSPAYTTKWPEIRTINV